MVLSPSSGGHESNGSSQQPLVLYLWSGLLLVVPLAIAAWLRAGASPRAIAIVTLLSAVSALVGGLVAGYHLHSARDVVRAAVIAGGAFSLGVFIIPVSVADATSSGCTTLDCDLGPSLSALVFFGISSLVLFVIIGTGYRFRRWQ